MSRRKEMIILEPDGRIHKEAFCTRPMTCPYCGGKGWFYGDQKDSDHIDCPDCEGTGEVIALVTIDWKPNKNKML